ncbi:M16 family metallopeptidase [Paracoccus sp. P2]|uniref:Insulinase family protein n=1 Tax=Paracoccus pantotrophus TaxID=82367 RepID=A0A1I5BC05_PARPN|nr:pitrilysin family protein [Paracoccus pantotrophus]MDF3852782.1 pitrilysin family protein [Paracoccus pantotrophus]QFG36727.1 insulinase family protein [Paracoccus pantotrophus]QLH14290.1 insulinase family protein [Paracoccus pantotrophus]RDD98097.1 insulinase family protein [Paracoccus pantotrophus]RKS52872.1 zinc protease [Paracoccus pantotrophus]
MIRALAALAFVALAALPASLQQARAIEIQQITSPGGITAWLVEDHSIPFTALSLMFRGGASLDAPGKRGQISLMTALLEEGSGQMDSVQYAEAVEGLGAQNRFDVGDDALTVNARMLTENRDEAAELLRQALAEPRFDPDAVERVRAQLQAVIRAEATDPNAIASKELARQAWGEHPYASSINGTAESVAALSRDDLIAAKDRVLARDRVVVAAAGDISAEELGRLIDKVLGGLPEQGSAPLPDKARLQLTGGVTVIDWDSPQTVVSFAQPGLPMSDPDYFAAYVADHILGGGGFSSRLMDEIREKRGLTYGVRTGLANGVYGETWQGGMASANDKVAEAVGLIRQEWDRFAQGGVTEKELADAKTYLTGEYALRFDGNGKIAGILAGMQLIGLPADYVNTRNGKIEAVTAADVQRVAKRLLHAGQIRFVLVGRPEGIDATN